MLRPRRRLLQNIWDKCQPRALVRWDVAIKVPFRIRTNASMFYINNYFLFNYLYFIQNKNVLFAIVLSADANDIDECSDVYDFLNVKKPEIKVLMTPCCDHSAKNGWELKTRDNNFGEQNSSRATSSRRNVPEMKFSDNYK
jgi:hypothetical protein